MEANGDSQPAFSPDSRQVAFRRGQASSIEDIYVVPVEGGAPRRVTFDNRGTNGHTWASDGRSLIVASRRATDRGNYGGSQSMVDLPCR
jgi:Tol biopolymer transport system component